MEIYLETISTKVSWKWENISKDIMKKSIVGGDYRVGEF